jgi:hypothetical protein
MYLGVTTIIGSVRKLMYLSVTTIIGSVRKLTLERYCKFSVLWGSLYLF